MPRRSRGDVMSFAISADFIATENARHAAALAEDYDALGRQLARRGISVEAMTERATSYAVAVPTWGVGTGGTRFARFPGPGRASQHSRQAGGLRRHHQSGRRRRLFA